jgi:tetratricopeptide (TPR) repeat protein
MLKACMRLPILILTLVSVLASACSAKRMGINRMADALSSTASAFGRDDDPEFVRVAAPSTLKMVEMLIDEQPRHPGLLMTACSGFTQYAYGFLQMDAEMLPAKDAAAARVLKDRAARMYDRARGYCVRHLELRHPGIGAALGRDPRAALAAARIDDVPALYWAAAAWGGHLSLAGNPLMRLGEVATVRALLTRAVALDEDWEQGAVHEALIAVEGLPVLLGGSQARARAHFDRAVELSKGQSAFAYVAMAASLPNPAKERAEFERLLTAALAIDASRTPSLRLANLIAQRRAKFLLAS